jgi:cyclopropane fatty-acyl-phospholipid synthase-like methyltransferase
VNSRLYVANAMHARFSPVEHRFRYPVFTLAFDLDELPALDRTVRGFGYNRRALVSLRDRDYLRGQGTIRERLLRFLREAGCDDGIARVELLTMPRMFGHVFNPVSFHYCYRADGSVRCVVAEVNNTFGERHLYILALGGDVGFGESHTDGEWTTDDLPALLTLLVRNLERLGAAAVSPGLAARFANCILHACRRNTARGSRRNIRAHYDLGNDFYQLWLDPETMLYSCAVFGRPGQTLADAQRAKIQRIIELAGIGPDHHVLEIGCGWGGFAIEAARRTGCRVTGITISEAQLQLARERVASAGLADRVDLRRLDYREVTGQYDRIVSIEMLEAVGHEYFGVFFRKCADVLKPGGRIALQVITIPDGRYESYRRSPDWIQKHIFPGGLLPSRSILDAAMASAGLRVERADNIGRHYPATLRAWRERFNARADDLSRMGFDAAFQRQWNYYFAYCEAGFSTEFIDDWQYAVAVPATCTLETLPAPTDAKVRLRAIPARRMAAVRYSGTWSERRYEQNLARLRAWMKAQGLAAAGDPVWARYNAPFTPWFMRRNEILLPIGSASGTTAKVELQR